MKRSLAILAAITLAVTLNACSSSGTSPTPSTSPSTASATIQDVTGMKADDARDALTKAGYVVKFTTTDGSTVILASNWTVLSQDPAAGTPAATGTTVTLTAEKTKKTQASTPEPSASPAEATTTGLTYAPASVACDNAGKTAFPYGYDPHWILGVIATRVEGDHWFMKYQATVKNQFNAKRDVTIECTVAGSDDAPTVTGFNAY